MKKIFLTIALLCCLAPVASAQPSEATYNYLHKTYTLAEDGSVELRVRSSLTYNTQSSFFSMFGETFIEYNPEYQTLTINESYTRQVDGSITKSPDNAFNEVLPRSAADAPAYNHLREMVVTHVGMERGATAFLDYTISTSAEMLGGELDFTEVISQYACDIRKGSVTVILPKGKTLRAAVVDANGKSRVQTISGKYTWNFANVKPFFREQYAPAQQGKVRIYATTLPSEESVAERVYYGTRDIVRLSSERMAGKDSFEEKVAAIGGYVGKMVACVPINPALNGFRHAQERSVDERCYGTVLDKAFLLNKLLAGECLESEVVLIYPSDCPLRNLSGYVDVAVKVSGDGSTKWLNCNGGEFMPSSKADRYTMLSTLSGGDASVEHVSDVAHDSYEVSVEGSKVTITAEDGTSRNVSVSLSDGPTGLRKVVLPSNNPVTRLAGLNVNRTEPFELYNTICRSESFTVKVADGEFVTKSRSERVRNSLGEASWSVVVDGDTATVTCRLEVNRSVVWPSEWSQLRALLVMCQNSASLSLLAR